MTTLAFDIITTTFNVPKIIFNIAGNTLDFIHSTFCINTSTFTTTTWQVKQLRTINFN